MACLDKVYSYDKFNIIQTEVQTDRQRQTERDRQTLSLIYIQKFARYKIRKSISFPRRT